LVIAVETRILDNNQKAFTSVDDSIGNYMNSAFHKEDTLLYTMSKGGLFNPDTPLRLWIQSLYSKPSIVEG